MLRVYRKTAQQIEKENNERTVWQKFHLKPVSPCYILTDNGEKIDISELSEKQILSICTRALTQHANDRSDEDIFAAYRLTEALKGYYEPSYDGLKTIIGLYQNDNQTIRSNAHDLFTPLVDEKLREINTIAKFLQESKGNYEAPTYDQMLQVIDQQIKNEQNKRHDNTMNQ